MVRQRSNRSNPISQSNPSNNSSNSSSSRSRKVMGRGYLPGVGDRERREKRETREKRERPAGLKRIKSGRVGVAPEWAVLRGVKSSELSVWSWSAAKRCGKGEYRTTSDYLIGGCY